MSLYCDYKATISIAYNPAQHNWTKHVEVDKHFINNHLNSGIFCTPFVKTKNQLVDILTKGLSSIQFSCTVGKLGM